MSSTVRISDLRHRVIIEAPARTADGQGGADVVWVNIAEVWAGIWPRTASESLQLDRTAGTATHDIWIRYRTGVRPDMRIRDGGRIFDIRGVLDAGDRKRWLKCIVEQRDL